VFQVCVSDISDATETIGAGRRNLAALNYAALRKASR
jgi:hypothetical protein